MNAEDVIESHPLRLLEGNEALPRTEVSLLLARSGVGKSTALINFAIDEIMRGRHVYHFSAGMPSEKTHQYYQKVFNDYALQYPPPKEMTWDEIYHHFTVISYLDSNKMIADLDTELDTVLSGDVAPPGLILIDGLDFDEHTHGHLETMNALARKHNAKVLASLRIHRTSDGDIDLEGPVNMADDQTSHIYFLEPDPTHDRINLELVSTSGAKMLPVFFCPHDFIFKAT